MEVYGQLLTAGLERRTSDPAGADLFIGRMWFRTDTEKYHVRGASDTKEFADLTSAQTFQNKVLAGANISDFLEFDEQGSTPANPAAGKRRIFFKTDGTAYTLAPDGTELPLGSGSGGSKNYFEDADARIDSNIGAWETDDGAGSPSGGLSLAVTSVAGELLQGTNSLKLTKDAADRNGHFIKVQSKTIDPADRGRPNYGSFQFRPGTGYVSSDLAFEVYDVTNAAVLYSGQAADLELLNFRGRFNWVTYLEDTTAQVEFRIKVNNTNTNGFTVFFDEFKFGPTAVLSAPIVTEWIPTTLLLEQTGTNPSLGSGGNFTDLVYYRRVGDTMHVRVNKRFGNTGTTAGTGNAFVGPIPGFPVDATKMGATAASFPMAGSAQFSNVSGIVDGFVLYSPADDAFFFYYDNGTASVNLSGSYWNTDSQIKLEFSYPIADAKTGNVVNTNELSLQTVKAEMHLNADQNILSTALTEIAFDDSLFDTHNIFDQANNRFIIPKSGYYLCDLNLNYAAVTTDERVTLAIRRNGSGVAAVLHRAGPTDGPATLSKLVYFEKGDFVTVTSQSTADTDYIIRGSESLTCLTITEIPDFSLYGAVDNYEILETATTIAHGFTGNANTFYVPTTTFKLDLTPGTWELYAQVYTDVVTTGGNARPEIALSTSTTPGADIIRRENSSGGSTTSNIDRMRVTVVKVPEYIVTENTSIYVHVYLLNTSGFTTSSSAQLGSIGNANSRLMARRLK